MRADPTVGEAYSKLFKTFACRLFRQLMVPEAMPRVSSRLKDLLEKKVCSIEGVDKIKSNQNMISLACIFKDTVLKKDLGTDIVLNMKINLLINQINHLGCLIGGEATAVE